MKKLPVTLGHHSTYWFGLLLLLPTSGPRFLLTRVCGITTCEMRDCDSGVLGVEEEDMESYCGDKFSKKSECQQFFLLLV